MIVAATFRQRLLGIHGAPPATAVLVRTASVHGTLLRRPLPVAVLDRQGMVLGTVVLAPGRAVRFPGAAWVLEIPTPLPMPGQGDRIVVLPSCES